MSEASDMKTEKLINWVKNGQKEQPGSRMCYGGVTSDTRVHLKTNEGEVITYSLHGK